jgi:AcrR family transcriptional regulator
VVSSDDVVLGACRFFLRHATVDMDRVAVDLAISRATLYRVVHSRDRLLGDVLWRLAEAMLNRARQRRTAAGVDGVLEITRTFSAALLDSEPFREFLRTEPDTAARVLFTASGGVHRRAVAVQCEILHDLATEEGWPEKDLDHLAYLYVRLIESMLYAELLTGRRPDPELAERAIRALLQPI